MQRGMGHRLIHLDTPHTGIAVEKKLMILPLFYSPPFRVANETCPEAAVCQGKPHV